MILECLEHICSPTTCTTWMTEYDGPLFSDAIVSKHITGRARGHACSHGGCVLSCSRQTKDEKLVLSCSLSADTTVHEHRLVQLYYLPPAPCMHLACTRQFGLLSRVESPAFSVAAIMSHKAEAAHNQAYSFILSLPSLAPGRKTLNTHRDRVSLPSGSTRYAMHCQPC